MDNLVTVVIDGKKHRLSPRAVELLKLGKRDIVKKEAPPEIKMMPIKQEIIKINKVEPVVKKEPEKPVEVIQETVPEIAPEIVQEKKKRTRKK